MSFPHRPAEIRQVGPGQLMPWLQLQRLVPVLTCLLFVAETHRGDSGQMAEEGIGQARLQVPGALRTVEGVEHRTSGLFGGVRAGFRAGGARPFLHVLAGAVRGEDSITVFSNTISERHTSFGGAAGGGLDFGGGRFGARVQADYRVSRRTAADGTKETHGDPRFSAGVVFRMGKR